MNSPTACALYARGLAYNDEYFFFHSDPILEAALQTWRRTGDGSEVRSLLAYQEANHESADMVVSTHASLAEAEAAVEAETLKMVSELTFVDLGFFMYSIGGANGTGDPRWYSMADDDDKWNELFGGPQTENPEQDLDRLHDWCDSHNWPRPKKGSAKQRAAIAGRSMEQFWAEIVDEEPEAFAADIVDDQLKAAGRNDLLLDLWATLVGPVVFVGPPPGPAEPLDLRTLSYFSELGIDTSGFAADSLMPDGAPASTSAPTPPTPTTPTTPTPPSLPKPASKGLFGRLFGR